ncbi:hypothetical protein RJ640_030067 [Escallonia rubra]|uniref:RING-type domain-containing protein n=1 Tax=Escallonia rubra TaxID=112253 RepID=A0AA88QKY5_9ASTE|nr:hypothetical protein RJ640_030067 [Escallonia rubra]
MECLHRFCRECIDKSMRLGNNECPACRTHCASRRSLRDDPNYDALIAALYPDIDKYEEEELAFHEEEKARNKQIQASIAQTSRRQSEALGRKRTTARATAAAFVRRSQGTTRRLRGRKNYRAAELQGSDNEETDNGHDKGKDSSSADEHITEAKPKRYKRSGGARFSKASLAASSADGGYDENDSEVNKESAGASAGLVSSSDMLAWGRGGMRSHTRHGSLIGSNGKNTRNGRLSKLLDCLRNSEENDDGVILILKCSFGRACMCNILLLVVQLDIHLFLVSLDEQRIPSLRRPNICCKPSLSVRQLCQYVALQTSVQADEVEMLLVKELHSHHDPSSSPSSYISGGCVIDPCKDELHILEEHETLVGLQAMCNFRRHYLLLAYRQKFSGLVES